jgi:hypothetical protein
MSRLIETIHFVKGLDPVADAFDDSGGAVVSDVVDMSEYNTVLFVIHYGVGTTGTQLFTVLACDDVTPNNSSAIPFHYRQILTTDVPGDMTAATTAGFTTTAGSSKIVVIEASAAALAGDGNGYGYIQLSCTEPADHPCLAGITIIMTDPRYGIESTDRTQIL